MYRFSKKVEYAILALQYMAASKESQVSAKEMSEHLNISFEFLSKTLQTLMKYGLVLSHQGIKGGYMLAKDAKDISITDIVNSLEKRNGLVECISNGNNDGCGRVADCTIREPLKKIQRSIEKIFDNTTVAELVGN
jgi:Rrf2 family protein